MKHIIILILTFISLSGIAQNPLKKEIIGNNQTEKMVNSSYTFKHAKDKSVLMRTLVDNRSANWNKQINDSTRIDLIKDFWKKSYIEIVDKKIESDLTKSNIKISTAQMPDDYVITPTIDIHFPNFVVYPKMGYWVLTKINVEVSKNGISLFTKGYMDNFFFTDGVSGYDKSYDKDHLNGTDAGMWIGMQHVLDKFYADLDLAFNGQNVESSDIPLEVASIESNIYNDESLVGTETPYSKADKAKVEKTNLQENNYKVLESGETPTPVDPTLETGLAALGIDKKKEEQLAAQKKIEEEAQQKKKEEAQKAQKAQLAKVEQKRVQDSLDKIAQALQEKIKTDSLKSISGEIAKQRAIDSITKVKEEEAKKIKEEELARKQKSAELAKAQAAIKDSIQKANQIAQAQKIEAKKVADSLKKLEVNKKQELAQKKKEEEKQKLAQKQPKQQVAQKTQEQFKNAPSKSDDISSIIKELAREVEAEDRQGVYTTSKGSASTAAQKRTEINNEQKAKLDSLKVLREQERAQKAAELAKLQEEQKAKAQEKIKEEKLANYTKDSIEYAQKLIKRNEAIAKAQELAKKQDEADLIKNPNAAYAYAAPSADPPSKMPDNRTAEQRKQDRVFKPKNVISEQLLSQVKMVSPVEEAKLLAQFGQNNEVAVDSVLIAEQMNKEVKSLNELKAIEKTAEEKKALLEKKLKEMKPKEKKGKKGSKDTPKATDSTSDGKPIMEKSVDSAKVTEVNSSELINEAVDKASDKDKAGTIEEEVKGKTIEKSLKDEPAKEEEESTEDLIKKTVIDPNEKSIEGDSKTTEAVKDIQEDIETKKEEISKKIKEITGE